MVWAARIGSFLKRQLNRRSAEVELDAEIASHYELLAERYIARGMEPEAARRAARVEFGGEQQVKEKVREAWAGATLETFWRDVRYALRSLGKSPVVTGVAVLSLALGIGANTAIFSVINAVILRPLPVREPEQLVSIYTISPEDGDEIQLLSLPMINELQGQRQVFSTGFAWRGGELNSFNADGHNFAGILTSVTGDYFDTLGMKPLLGRLIQPGDVAVSSGASAQVAVLAYRCWQARFHGDPAIVGKTIRVDDRPLTIIGVTPQAFSGLIIDMGEDVTVPLGVKGDTNFRRRESLGLGGYARLKPGVSLKQARAHLKAMWPNILRATEPAGITGARRTRFYARRIEMESAATGHSNMRRRISEPLTLLMALAAIVLLITCVNLANLMLARAAGRRHELAVRTALGASQWRLSRQLLTESLLLSLGGAAIGFGVSVWTSRFLTAAMWTGPVALALDAGPDPRVIAFTITAALVTAVLFGLGPALRSSRADPAQALSSTGRSVRGAGRMGKLLVTGQVALSMAIVLAAALLMRSLQNMQTVNPGFQRHGVLVMPLMAQPGRQRSSNQTAYYRQMVDELMGVPGVISASFSNVGPVNRGEGRSVVTVGNAAITASADIVGPSFFQMIGMHVLAGREFQWTDTEKSPPVTVISRSLAIRLFPDRDAVGQFVVVDPGVNQRRLQVVGVVNSASLWRIQSREPRAFYTPLLQASPTGTNLDVRYVGDPSSVTGAVREIVENLGHEYPLYIQTVEERVRQMTAEERMLALLAAFFGALALLLASIGLYGLMADSVMRRTPEIGIRMALGAERSAVVGMVLREVLALVGVGILTGLLCALAASRAIKGMLFGLSATDPATVCAAAFLLGAVALFAGYIPAQQASRIDPMTALRAS